MRNMRFIENEKEQEKEQDKGALKDTLSIFFHFSFFIFNLSSFFFL